MHTRCHRPVPAAVGGAAPSCPGGWSFCRMYSRPASAAIRLAASPPEAAAFTAVLTCSTWRLQARRGGRPGSQPQQRQEVQAVPSKPQPANRMSAGLARISSDASSRRSSTRCSPKATVSHEAGPLGRPLLCPSAPSLALVRARPTHLSADALRYCCSWNCEKLEGAPLRASNCSRLSTMRCSRCRIMISSCGRERVGGGSRGGRGAALAG